MNKFVVIAIFVSTFTFANTAPVKKRKDGMTAEKAMSYLKKGNARFLAGEVRKSLKENVRQNPKDKFNPHTIVIACSDSRISPELVLDQKAGDVLVVRVAGEVLDPSVIAAAEQAISQYGTKNIFVLGHTGCEMVKSALTTKEGASKKSEYLEAALTEVRTRASAGRKPASEPTAHYAIEAANNAEGVANDLMKKSQVVKEAVDAGKVQVHWGLHHMDTGVVDFH